MLAKACDYAAWPERRGLDGSAEAWTDATLGKARHTAAAP